MSSCEMKGYLNFLTLRLIKREPRSGQNIRQELAKRKGCKPSPGTIYPVLKQLLDNNLIQEKEQKGRSKIYEITPAGEKELELATEQFVQTFCCMKQEFSKRL